MKLHEIMFESMRPTLLKIFEKSCKEMLENPAYKVLQIFEHGILAGFACYKECKGYRELSEGHYLGKRSIKWLEMWRFCTKGAKKMVALVQKENDRAVKFYKNRKFKIVKEDNNNYLFEKG